MKHKEEICPEDRERLDLYFDDVLTSNDPVQLTMFVWYNITVHFGLRGNEIRTKMVKTDLGFQRGDSGEFIVLSSDFASKNGSRELASREFETVGRIQDEKQVDAVCLFLEKLNSANNRLSRLVAVPSRFFLAFGGNSIVELRRVWRKASEDYCASL